MAIMNNKPIDKPLEDMTDDELYEYWAEKTKDIEFWQKIDESLSESEKLLDP